MIDFLKEYFDTIGLIITLALSVIAIVRALNSNKLYVKNSENMLKGLFRKEIKDMKEDILSKFNTNRLEAKYEKQIEFEKQQQVCKGQCQEQEKIKEDVSELKEEVYSLKDERMLNLEIQDIILEVMQPQGNGRITDMRKRLKQHLYDKSTNFD